MIVGMFILYFVKCTGTLVLWPLIKAASMRWCGWGVTTYVFPGDVERNTPNFLFRFSPLSCLDHRYIL